MTIRLDAIESATGAAFGLLVGIAANYTVLPMWGFTPSAGQSVQIGVFFFALSFANRFVFRRVFRWFE
jgi:hypothetical protein